MKRLFTLCAIVVAVVVSSCSKFDDTDIWDKLNDHESRITALEELCKQMNTNITALQTIVEALEKNDYITNVSPVRKDGEVIGYNISFAKSDSITIYHGDNGRDGADGKDGYTPQIGVMKDTDGIYYWTLDGEWVLDGNGDKIKAVGDDGIDGTTPRLKIENDCWYVSYDNGVTWVELGKSVSDNCLNKDNIFISVTQDDEYVYFNLADGLSIIIKKQNNDSIIFEDIKVRAICCRKWDTNCDNQLSYSEAKNITDISGVFNGNTEIIAFEELKYFTSLTSIPDNAFNGCKSLSIIKLPNGITSIGNNAFQDCTSLYTIEIPENVTSIGDNAFSSCNDLNNITIPASLASVGINAFHFNNNTPKNIFIKDLYAWCKIQFDNSLSQPLHENGNLYLNGNLVTDIIIPNDVTMISKYAFTGCGSIVNLTIGSNVEVIDEYAFLGCKNLKTIAFNDNLSSIEKGAFSKCLSINEISIPDNIILTNIGEHAFSECDNLKKVILGDGVQHIGASAFIFCDNLYCVWIGKGIALIEYRSFQSCPQLSQVYCEAITPPNILYDPEISNDYWAAFYPVSSSLKIYVPNDYISNYKNSRGWNSYKNNIYGYDFENNVVM